MDQERLIGMNLQMRCLRLDIDSATILSLFSLRLMTREVSTLNRPSHTG
jgi:hypothetical protein